MKRETCLVFTDGLMYRYFGVKSSKKAAHQVKSSAEKLGLVDSNEKKDEDKTT